MSARGAWNNCAMDTGQQRQRRRLARALGVPAVALLAAFILSACFMISIADRRSPFDDPFGTSYSDLDRAVPKIEEALKDLDDREGDWLLDTMPGETFACEGACQLRVEVSISPAREDQDLVVPADLLREVLLAAVPVAEAEKVNLNVYGWYSERGELGGDYTSERAEMADAADALFGGRGPDTIIERGYSVKYSLASNSASVVAFTEEYTDVLTLMGLE